MTQLRTAFLFLACLVFILAGCATPAGQMPSVTTESQRNATQTVIPPSPVTADLQPTATDGTTPSVQDTSAYQQLPEITLASAVRLTASPTHPTAYLPLESIPAGGQVRVLGDEPDAAWLLVLYDDTLGWMPAFFAATGTAVLNPPARLKPLAEQCNVFVDTAIAPDQVLTAPITGSAVVRGVMYRPEPTGALSEGAISLQIVGSGRVASSNIDTTPLSPGGEVSMFTFNIAEMQKDSEIKFILSGPESEPLAFQATLFRSECADEPSASTEIGAVTDKPDKTEEPKVIERKASIWSVRAYAVDDAAAVLVDGEMVAGMVLDGQHQETGWVDITDRLSAEKETRVVFVSWNGYGGGRWAFSLRRGDTVVWGEEGSSNSERTMQYMQAITIRPDGSVVEVTPDVSATRPPPGRWAVRAQEIADIGLVLVNGWPVGGAFGCDNCNRDLQNTDWIDITSYLDSGQENIVEFRSWLIEGTFRYRFSIARDGVILWEREGGGEQSPGAGSSDTVRISGKGVIEQEAVAQPAWSVRAYAVDDAAAVLVDGEMVAGMVLDGQHRETGWVDITDRVSAEKETQMVFVSWNGYSGGQWGFSLRRGDTVVWGEEGSSNSERTMQYMQAITIRPDGSVVEVTPDVSATRPPPGRWAVRAQEIADIGLILVNGWPVGGAFGCDNCNRDLQNTDWIDITSYLDSGQENIVEFRSWLVEGTFRYRFSMARDEVILWEREGNGARSSGAVASDAVTISGKGVVEQEAVAQPAWSVRAYAVDDAAAVLVDGEMVAGMVLDGQHRETGWVDITDRLSAEKETRVVFVSWNGYGGGQWGFSLRRGDTVVWGEEGSSNSERTMQYMQAITIRPDGSVVEVTSDMSATRPPPGRWAVRAQEIADIGLILVNGWPVGGAFGCDNCNRDLQNTDWIDITSLLHDGTDNSVAFAAWNVTGAFSFSFALQHDEVTSWEFSRSGSGILGKVFEQRVQIDAYGRIIED